MAWAALFTFVGLAWCVRSLQSFADPHYTDPVTASDWFAVFSFSAALFTTALALPLMARMVGGRAVFRVSLVPAVAAALTGLGNLLEDGLQIGVAGLFYGVGAGLTWVGLIAFAVAIAVSGRGRGRLLATVPAATVKKSFVSSYLSVRVPSQTKRRTCIAITSTVEIAHGEFSEAITILIQHRDRPISRVRQSSGMVHERPGPALAGRSCRCQGSGTEIDRPDRCIAPGRHSHVMTSTVRRPDRTAGSRSASRRVSSREPVAKTVIPRNDSSV